MSLTTWLRSWLDRTGEAAQWVARFGYAAKGIVGIAIGVLAIRVATGYSSRPEGPAGALREMLQASLGQVLILVIALGLIAFAIWLMVKAVADPERKGDSVIAVGERIGFFVTGLGYVTLALAGFRLLSGQAGPSGTGTESLTARLMAPFMGRFVVGLIGGIVMLAGVLQARLAITGRFRKQLDEPRMSRSALRFMTWLGRIGYLSLSVTSLLTGVFLVRAAWRYDASVAAGLGEILGILLQQDYGRLLVGVVGTGFGIYGLYSLLLARYRDVPV